MEEIPLSKYLADMHGTKKVEILVEKARIILSILSINRWLHKWLIYLPCSLNFTDLFLILFLSIIIIKLTSRLWARIKVFYPKIHGIG